MHQISTTRRKTLNESRDEQGATWKTSPYLVGARHHHSDHVDVATTAAARVPL